MRVSSVLLCLFGVVVAVSEEVAIEQSDNGVSEGHELDAVHADDNETGGDVSTTQAPNVLPPLDLGPGWMSIITLVLLCMSGPVFFYVKGLIGGEEEAQRRDEFAKRRTTAILGEEREESSFAGYIFSLLGYAIGIANVWRFPYVVGENGGGAFVIAYLACLFFVSLPMFFNELAFGHALRKSTIDAFRWVHRRWVGLGYAQVLLVFLISINFNVVIAWAMIYLGASMAYPLPWSDGRATQFWHETVLNQFENSTLTGSGQYPDRIPESPEFGAVQWHLALALGGVHILNFCAIAFGKETLEQITSVTVIAPIIMMIVLLIQAVQLDGAMDGIRFYIIRIDWSRLWSINHWRTACSQILFSLGPGFSTGVTSSSATAPHANVYQTALIVGCANSGFSILGGFAIYSILGNVAFRQTEENLLLDPNATKVEMEEVAASGPGLAFIAIAEGMKTFGAFEPVMATLFFAMLVTLGCDSSFAWIDTVVTVLQDSARSYGYSTNKLLLTGGVCFALWVTGLLYCTRAGLALHTSTWNYIGSVFLLLGVCVEGILLATGFGWEDVKASVKKATATDENPEGATIHLAPLFSCAMRSTMLIAPWFLFLSTVWEEFQEPYAGLPLWIRSFGYAGLGFLTIITFSTFGLSAEDPSEEMEMGAEALDPKEKEEGVRSQYV